MKTNMQKYPNYKDSGAEWLGDLPIHWESIKMKHLFQDVSIKKKADAELLSVTQDQGVVPRTWVENRMVMPSGALESFKFINKGDFAISLRSFEGGLEYCHHDGIISPAYTVLKAKRTFESQFYKYLFKSFSFISELQTSVVGIRQGKNISFEELSYSYLPIPPLPEQTAIAAFLDRKTALIDQAIGIKQKQIELLKERRQILIHNAVTRGLNPNVKLKHSGVEWIGEIPEEWEVKKLLGICNFLRGNSTFSKDELLYNGDYVALQYGKTYKVDEINDSYGFYINKEFYKETQIVKYDDTILISTSETIEDLGHSAYYNRNDLGLIGGEQILLNPKNKKIDGHYLYFYSKLFSRELRKYATGIKVFRFNVNNLKTIYISIPPLSEQKQIVEFIKIANTKTSTAISLKEQEIEKLKEYKATLINSAVTGKIKVS